MPVRRARFKHCRLLWIKNPTNPKTLQDILGLLAEQINMLQASAEFCYRFCFAGSKGDLECQAMAYKMVRYYRCSFCCHKCWCTSIIGGWRANIVEAARCSLRLLLLVFLPTAKAKSQTLTWCTRTFAQTQVGVTLASLRRSSWLSFVHHRQRDIWPPPAAPPPPLVSSRKNIAQQPGGPTNRARQHTSCCERLFSETKTLAEKGATGGSMGWVVMPSTQTRCQVCAVYMVGPSTI